MWWNWSVCASEAASNASKYRGLFCSNHRQDYWQYFEDPKCCFFGSVESITKLHASKKHNILLLLHFVLTDLGAQAAGFHETYCLSYYCSAFYGHLEDLLSAMSVWNIFYHKKLGRGILPPPLSHCLKWHWGKMQRFWAIIDQLRPGMGKSMDKFVFNALLKSVWCSGSNPIATNWQALWAPARSEVDKGAGGLLRCRRLFLP